MEGALKPPPSGHAFFVSVHIPKAAGTTVAAVLERVYQRRILFDYPDVKDYSTPDKLIKENSKFIASFFRGIHGHFSVKRHLPVFGGAKFISCVRHPVDRIISQFIHEYNDAGPGSYWHEPIRSGELNIIDFAAMPGIGDGMSQHLEGLPLEDYDLIMLAETLDTSFALLDYVVGHMDIEAHFGLHSNLPRENRGAARTHHLEFSESTKAEIYNRASQDVELYRWATENLGELARKYLT